MAGVFSGESVELVEISRFDNTPVEKDGALFWNWDLLLAEIKAGLLKLADFAAARGARVSSIGIDSWAVDYALLDQNGQLLAMPRHYRDARNALGVAAVHDLVTQEKLFEQNGLQFLPFNTLYQLTAEQLQDPELFSRAKTILLIPDLIAYVLCGKLRAEVTNASTTGLLNVSTHTWNEDLSKLLGIPAGILPKLIQPGEVYGTLNNPDVSHEALVGTEIIAVASHDTASAVLAVPKLDADGAYLSSGTWSLIGIESDTPILSQSASKANFTNELGVNSMTRFLKNISGLWLIQECIRTWNESGQHLSVEQLIAEADGVTTQARVDVNDPEFTAPGNMPSRIQAHVARNGGIPPQTPAEITRCIFESLATAYAGVLAELESVTGRKILRLNIVGGGSQNSLLSQLAADYCGIEVVSGPVEATAIGNLTLQAAKAGLLTNSSSAIREFVALNFPVSRFSPGA